MYKVNKARNCWVCLTLKYIVFKKCLQNIKTSPAFPQKISHGSHQSPRNSLTLLGSKFERCQSSSLYQGFLRIIFFWEKIFIFLTDFAHAYNINLSKPLKLTTYFWGNTSKPSSLIETFLGTWFHGSLPCLDSGSHRTGTRPPSTNNGWKKPVITVQCMGKKQGVKNILFKSIIYWKNMSLTIALLWR